MAVVDPMNVDPWRMPDMSLRPGEAFAGYVIQRELGSGGMGAVYLARRHPGCRGTDAIKLLRPELCNDPAFVRSVRAGGRYGAQLDHPNIVSVYDRGSSDGQLWVSMRFIDGTNAERALAEYARGARPIEQSASSAGWPRRWTTPIATSCCIEMSNRPTSCSPPGPTTTNRASVSFRLRGGPERSGRRRSARVAHQHRQCWWCTLDTRLTGTDSGPGPGHRSDIYALGCVLYKLLTGVVPFPGDSIASRVYDHLRRSVRPPSNWSMDCPRGSTVVATAIAQDRGSIPELSRVGDEPRRLRWPTPSLPMRARPRSTRRRAGHDDHAASADPFRIR